MLDYAVHQKANSVYNTPPTFPIYMAKLVFDWIKDDIGGLAKMAELNEKKANLLYETIDNSVLFEATIKDRDRSWMNVPFISKTGDAELEAKFIKEAGERGLVTLKGHRSVGGMRQVSITPCQWKVYKHLLILLKILIKTINNR